MTCGVSTGLYEVFKAHILLQMIELDQLKKIVFNSITTRTAEKKSLTMLNTFEQFALIQKR